MGRLQANAGHKDGCLNAERVIHGILIESLWGVSSAIAQELVKVRLLSFCRRLGVENLSCMFLASKRDDFQAGWTSMDEQPGPSPTQASVE